ncbi:hypothetical protein BKA65DRAFT_220616 [Rhexocercosporidium sp. MPI-PUGE-AT-0058]|nr:hypothetical protein BKA65DRAFT_220616 [Rhexocercosporidium sp. MPI-PUGE-AT-0058]
MQASTSDGTSCLNATPVPHYDIDLSSPYQGDGREKTLGSSQSHQTHPKHQKPHDSLPNQWQYPPPRSRSFSITTDTDSLSSGFPYSYRLAELQISPTQWLKFSNQVVSAAKLTTFEDGVAWTAGVATGAGASALLLVFGPVVGYYTGKAIHKKTVVKKVKEKLTEEGSLSSVLRQWNEGPFREQGFQVTLEPPTEKGEVLVDAWPGASSKDLERAAARLARRFRIVLVPFNSHTNSARISYGQSGPVSLPLQSAGGLSLAVKTSEQRKGSISESRGVASSSLHSKEVPHPPLPPRPRDTIMAELSSAQTQPTLFELDGNPVYR